MALPLAEENVVYFLLILLNLGTSEFDCVSITFTHLSQPCFIGNDSLEEKKVRT